MYFSHPTSLLTYILSTTNCLTIEYPAPTTIQLNVPYTPTFLNLQALKKQVYYLYLSSTTVLHALNFLPSI